MTCTHIKTITFGTCLIICVPTHTHARTHAHTHTHTHACIHFDMGTGTVGLPSLWGGASLLSSHIFLGGGLENCLGGV